MAATHSANEGWKHTLVDYVNAVNEACLRKTDNVQRMVADPQHRRRLAARLREEERREAVHGIKITRSEARARVERHQAAGQRDAAADVSLHIVRTCEQQGVTWQEERVERERIRFVNTGSRWRLDTIELLQSEGRQVMGGQQLTDAPDDDRCERRDVMPSLPYINMAPGHGLHSRIYAGPETEIYGGGREFGGIDNGYSAYSRASYRREEAAAYAERWWNEPNPSYEQFEVNCTNYVSQCLFAGRVPMNYTGRRESGWWYKGRSNGREWWSYSWAVADSLVRYLSRPRGAGLQAHAVGAAEDLRVGDVIGYDWDGSGRFGHNAIVTAFAPDGAPLVNANTVSSRHRYWDYRDSYAWTERTRYRFFHIADED